MDAGARQVHVQDGDIESDRLAGFGHQLRDVLVAQVMQRDFAFPDDAAIDGGNGCLVVVKDHLVTVFTLGIPALGISDHVAVDVVEEFIFSLVAVRALHDPPVGGGVLGAGGIRFRIGGEEEDHGVQLIQREAFPVDQGSVVQDLHGDVEVFLIPHHVGFHGAVRLAVPVLNLVDDLVLRVDLQALRGIPLAQVAVNHDFPGLGSFQVFVRICQRGGGNACQQGQRHQDGNQFLHVQIPPLFQSTLTGRYSPFCYRHCSDSADIPHVKIQNGNEKKESIRLIHAKIRHGVMEYPAQTALFLPENRLL